MVGLSATSLLSALFIFLAVALGTVALVLVLEWVQERRRQRDVLRQLRTFAEGDSEGRTVGGLLRSTGSATPQWLQPLAARLPALRDLELLLSQAGMTMTVSRLMVTMIGLAVAFGASALLLTRFWPAAIGAALVGALLPYVYVRRRRKKRMSSFEEMLPDAIDLLGRAIRAGHPISAGFKMAADETRDPIAAEFRRTHEENRFGLPFDVQHHDAFVAGVAVASLYAAFRAIQQPTRVR